MLLPSDACKHGQVGDGLVMFYSSGVRCSGVCDKHGRDNKTTVTLMVKSNSLLKHNPQSSKSVKAAEGVWQITIKIYSEWLTTPDMNMSVVFDAT